MKFGNAYKTADEIFGDSAKIPEPNSAKIPSFALNDQLKLYGTNHDLMNLNLQSPGNSGMGKYQMKKTVFLTEENNSALISRTSQNIELFK